MNILGRLGFRIGSDEMYMHISGLAARLSWLTLVAMLLGWSIYDTVVWRGLSPQLAILSMGVTVYWAVYMYVQRHLTGSREE